MVVNKKIIDNIEHLMIFMSVERCCITERSERINASPLDFITGTTILIL